jgi:two-component system, cell cycle response regulator DivK
MSAYNWNVLIVEDEYDSIQVMTRVLTYHGATVYVARNGRECLRILKDFTPSIILMDLDMPIMDGWEALAHIRANPATKDLPVVAITAYHSANVAEDAAHAGFNGYFAKPVSIRSIIPRLEQIIPNTH